MTSYKINPWNELNPYSEGQPIYGRNQIISKIVDTIYTNLQTILYGKSGIGKTSLLQAGCFPELRKRHFFPIVIRPGIMENSNDYIATVIDIIRKAAEQEIVGIKPSLRSINIKNGIFTENRLCQYLYSTKFISNNGDIFIPILIFDQFEEFLNKKRIYSYAVKFIKELYVLLDNTISIPAGFLGYSNYRLVFAIREDYLYCLEDIVDLYNLDELRYNRHRIPALTDKQAHIVIEKTFRSALESTSTEELKDIAKTIIPMAKGQNQDADIHTSVLSLLGSLIYQQIAKGHGITSINTDHEIYLYYDEIISEPNIPLRVRCFLEQKLITIDGRRESMDYQSALLTTEINEEHIKYLVQEKRILRLVDAGSGEKRLEFSHDIICKTLKPVLEMRQRFHELGYKLFNESFDDNNKQPEMVRYLSYASELGHFEARQQLEILYKDNVLGITEDKDFKRNNSRRDRICILLKGEEWSKVKQESRLRQSKYDIFLCYSRKDIDTATQLSRELVSLGCSIWMDIGGIETGQEFADHIVGAITDSRTFLFLCSENSMQSQWCARELFYAESLNKRIIPVRIDDSEFSNSFLYILGNLVCTDIRDTRQKERLFRDMQRLVCHDSCTSDNTGLESTKITLDDYEFEMIFVEGGKFIMGATLQQGGDNLDERNTHNVRLDSYYISTTTVTVELWEKVMGKKRTFFQSFFNTTTYSNKKYPIVDVSWKECTQFIKRLNEITGKEFRLPTEAEWEYAAKGGIKGRLNGFKYSGGNNLHNVSWNSENSDGHIHEVARKEPNELGLYDMSGNVWEWCSDWYGPYHDKEIINPQGAEYGDKKVCRGGCFKSKGRDCRISIREPEYPNEKRIDIGFRLALSL